MLFTNRVGTGSLERGLSACGKVGEELYDVIRKREFNAKVGVTLNFLNALWWLVYQDSDLGAEGEAADTPVGAPN